MMQGLQRKGLSVTHGAKGKFFAIIKTALRYRPTYIHMDWLHRYYLRRTHWMTWLLFPLFILEILVVRHLLGIKFVWTLHNITPHDKPYYGPYKWARLFFAKNCTWIRVFHQGTRDRVSLIFNIDPEKLRVVAEGSYVGYYPNYISREKARQQLEVSQKHLVLLYLGLIKPYKGILELLHAFKDLNLQDATLMIAGKAMDLNYLKKLKDEGDKNIKIVEGFVPDEELQLYYNSADLIVLPFRKIENSGSAILAMGFKKVIIAPKKGVLPERLKQQESLLYQERGLKDMLIKALDLKRTDLTTIGIENFNSLKRHTWEDFASCFD